VDVKSISEETLLARCLHNEAWAQKELYNRYSSLFYGICLRYAKNNDDAKDMLQEGFIKIFKSLQQYRGDGSLSGWMKRVIHTTCLNYITKHYKHKTEQIDQLGAEPTIHYVDFGKEDYNKIMESIMDLPYDYKIVLTLFCIEEYAHKEIARLLQIDEATSRSRLFRGKQMLAAKLAKKLLISTN
jgi:RNA polymerase sigma factor (sigma-70 family)